MENYLHLYLGQKVIYDEQIATLIEIDNAETCGIILGEHEYRGDVHVSKIKLILQPLSSMTQECLTEIFDLCYEYVYSNKREFELTFVSHGDELAIKAREFAYKNYDYGLTVNGNGVLFSVNGDFLNAPTFEVTRILLKHGFDLFSLKEKGLCVYEEDLKK